MKTQAKQKKEESMKESKINSKNKIKQNRRNHTNILSSNHNSINNTSNNKHKCSIWRKWINKESRTIKRCTIRSTSKRKVKFKIRRISN